MGQYNIKFVKFRKKYRAIIAPASASINGMLKKFNIMFLGKKLMQQLQKSYWIRKDEKTGYKKITVKDISEAGFKTIDELAASLSEGKSV